MVKKKSEKLSKIKKSNYLAGYLFIAPPIIGFILFGLIPIVFSIVVSFSSYDFFSDEFHYAGFDNYVRAFTDPIFIKSLKNIGIAFVGLFAQIIVSLMVALLLTYKIKGQTIFRSLFFIPSLCSTVAVTLIWKWVFNTDFGILNSILGALGLGKVGWLTDSSVVMFSMVLQGIWMGIGGGMVMYIAALKNVPSQYYEAAEIDGASGFQKFLRITIPMISPTTFYILVTSIIGTMTDFARYKIMTDGGPYYSSLTPGLYIYQTAFTSSYQFDYSYATAMSWIIGLISMILVAICFKTSKRWVHYNG